MTRVILVDAEKGFDPLLGPLTLIGTLIALIAEKG